MDEALKLYCTVTQWKTLEAIEECGSQKAAADKLGVNQSTITRQVQAIKVNAALHGYSPDHNMLYPAAPGFKIKGTSTLMDMTSGEPKIQWIKTTADAEQQEEALQATLAAFRDEIPATPSVKTPKHTLDHLMTVYPIGDHHVGMVAIAADTGSESYDLKRAEDILCGAMDHLVTTSPEAAKGTILVLGDFFHRSGFDAVTRLHKNQLDAAGTYPEMLRVGILILRFLIKRALQKHEDVTVVFELGNHDDEILVAIGAMFKILFEEEPRVTIIADPKYYHCIEFGKCMIGTHHGHKVKMNDLPLLFANDHPQIWANTVFRYIHTGHVHHDNVKEVVGAVIESHRILAPGDAFSAMSGYRSMQSMKALVLHRDFGEVARHTVNPQMLNL